MVRAAQENILVIADADRQLQTVLAQAMPLARISAADTWFDAIADLSCNRYSSVLAAVEPIERRPESAVRTVRHLAADARLILFGHPTLEPLSRKMLEFGCDDYLVTPTSPGELNQVFGAPLMRIAATVAPALSSEDAAAAESHPLLAGLPLVQIILQALHESPHAAVAQAVQQLNAQLAPTMSLVFCPPAAAKPEAPDGMTLISQPVRADDENFGQLHLLVPRDQDASAARHFLSRLAELVARLHQLQDRHKRLQKLAITDELTGLYNARYFRHFLSNILERARTKRFPVTLFLFDIDNFKKYNDSFGHAVGDQILKQTAALIRRCCREHDLVARVGGDEFAVVFWEKEGPRQPKEPKAAGTSGRVPQTPLDILGRFRRLLATEVYSFLGTSGKGTLTISGGLAVYPYDARTMEELIAAADNQLMFRAKQAGKNSVFLVGNPDQLAQPTDDAKDAK